MSTIKITADCGDGGTPGDQYELIEATYENGRLLLECHKGSNQGHYEPHWSLDLTAEGALEDCIEELYDDAIEIGETKLGIPGYAVRQMFRDLRHSNRHAMTLADFFSEIGCNQLWVCSTAQPSGLTISREAEDNEVFESCCTNPDFWDLRGGLNEDGNWECNTEDLLNCCDFRGNSLTRLVAIRA